MLKAKIDEKWSDAKIKERIINYSQRWSLIKVNLIKKNIIKYAINKIFSIIPFLIFILK